MVFDQTFLRDLVALKDEAGVVSLYSTANPREEASVKPAWGIKLRNELSAMREQVSAWPEKERRAAVLARLDALEPDIQELVDAAESGLGRALFAPVGQTDVHKISLQVPIDDCAVLESTAYVRPLVTAMATSAPAGLVLVSRSGLRLIDYRYGVAEDVHTTTFDPDTDEWRQMRGPGPGGTQQPAVNQLDKFQRRVDDNLRRFLHSASQEVSERVKSLGWTDVLLIGDPALTEVVSTALRPQEVVHVDTIVDALPATEVAKHVRGELAETREARDTALIARVRNAAMSGGRGVLGLNQTLALLNEGRVDHLLLDEKGHWSGSRGLDGYLYDQTPNGMAVENEPDLGERMIEAALNSGVTVTILGSEAAKSLSDYDGVAALLRW
ncbi:VLRF1 family aeRF1-type release factor [Nonomuraea sp. NBC_01738]|uniref:VLRF1 family aeRF1-type release factor n=1 Tax=Nonomuraea sp. NBC_01738 TaxID=2976003 RepID=UPI002E13D2B1|nr:VLRF1 family aeRF1-type release factor [Nonomuraea sp. NBC_01738]